MKFVKNARLYLLLYTLAFYLMPLLFRNRGGELALILAALPAVSFAVSAVYGIKNGFHFGISLSAGIIFLPTVYIFYNHTAWIYVVAYSAVSMAGNGLGALFFKRG